MNKRQWAMLNDKSNFMNREQWENDNQVKYISNIMKISAKELRKKIQESRRLSNESELTFDAIRL